MKKKQNKRVRLSPECGDGSCLDGTVSDAGENSISNGIVIREERDKDRRRKCIFPHICDEHTKLEK